MSEIEKDKRPLCVIRAGRKVEDAVTWLSACPSVYIVADRNTAPFAERVERVLEPFSNCRGTMLIDATEQNKTITTVLGICGWLMDKLADRKAMLFAIGGGITTDMAGFAASIYKRGIRFAYMPTTFLAQVDAAIGGKNGVNLDDFKNILGVIRQPEFTFECSEVLATLPYRDFISGAAELVKTFIIDNTSENYGKAVSILASIRKSNDHQAAMLSHMAELQDLVNAAALVKAGVVERDEFENGERRKLNLGHTFAHAIEWEARKRGDDITHGEAVAMGMILAARLSEGLYGNKGLENSLSEDFQAAGLPAKCPYSLEDLSSAMYNDKKAEGSLVHFVLISSIGDVRVEDLTVNQMLGYMKQ
ncbi:MAG: 3-dehydroquinate synthase family protein [Candidatus Cryptobacteroides sp.]|nr:3-dehydroquinate synthase [Bacteroidales bacterium]